MISTKKKSFGEVDDSCGEREGNAAAFAEADLAAPLEKQGERLLDWGLGG